MMGTCLVGVVKATMRVVLHIETKAPTTVAKL